MAQFLEVEVTVDLGADATAVATFLPAGGYRFKRIHFHLLIKGGCFE